ncbi:nicotinate-nucleotide--dimethylbenzimidazole phosphoribosyltransferase [Vibrio agarivorans]|uniref:nicotinate-nucleotide--dimethylbenzimidazole phosphoribosyltransferase n=1 Tax=Vibrio agarivorans TaxID=153622 RepID=UPI0025B3013A|nr:nicotinate-nucleotide--dimethylbenzimidazole phosphoribosyltransferase [Vibrio agarivorans]MDN3663260.1 nicotinate-nucleotide--dimethylbenzimidazole phosphoribosyltransferase [Vibrio agarivorans]
MMLNSPLSQDIQNKINSKTKPLGALGQLEQVALQMAVIQGKGAETAPESILVKKPTLIIFAGDHGIAEQGVSIAPSVVTQQMVANFLAGGAAANCFCRTNDVAMEIVDCGMIAPVPSKAEHYFEQRLGEGTRDFSQQAAMTLEQVERGLKLGAERVHSLADQGCNTVMFGEMGIGNTSSAAALLAVLSKQPVEQCVGYGTGVSNQQLALKRTLIEQAVIRVSEATPKQALIEVGGFEIVQIVGAFLAAQEHNMIVLVDGFIVSVAAYVATLMREECLEQMIFAHCSQESGHQLLLALLEAKPLLDLALRLGEGTGAVLALPLLRASAEFYNTMASFEQAGVTV